MKDLFSDKGEPIFSTDIDELQKSRDEEAKAQLARWKADFRDTFCATPHGRRVLWYLIHETHVYRKFGQTNAGAYALEGKRELGLEIVDIIGAEKMLASLLSVKRDAVIEDE